ncbi:hypothetical protein FPSE_02204 [Fusarium pseudograminearum CS3096]|uniref:Uncharacterized protein n=1 Tax=Fusarium pseudograminearum (strain CS3096) TaxID=1028729 RepID=K3UY56_FUSPC|nr:hypothetical protein FPSE_02204 [Fusarium pseudograminearum CS3096]EKJ77706.1 hypothetical protein FPSE_02204 [Fusarium pseudograminearum CS3096]KAF0641424.1 hypothetical protein FPSE5266_02204 [Fusarium pseudograminearum]
MSKCEDCDGHGLRGDGICAGCNGSGSRDSSSISRNTATRLTVPEIYPEGHVLNNRDFSTGDDVTDILSQPPIPSKVSGIYLTQQY